MVRSSFLQSLRVVLDEAPYFSATDFEVLEDTNNASAVRITYQYEKKYVFYLVVTEVHGNTPSFKFAVCPGRISTSASGAVSGMAVLENELKEWTTRIREDLRDHLSYRLSIENQEAIDSLLKNMQGYDDTYFTKEEAADLSMRLDNLREQFRAHLEQTNATDDEIKNQLVAIDTEIADLKEGLKTLRKSGWIRKLAASWQEWTNNPQNQPVLTAGKQLGGFLLQEGVKQVTKEH